jgi:hypothetical protein
MVTRRLLVERAESVLRARSDDADEGGAEATRCFLRAMLAGLDDDATVPASLVGRIAELLRIDVGTLLPGTPSEPSAMRPSSHPTAVRPTASADARRILLLARADGERLALCEGVARVVLDEATVRAAAMSPVPYDARALKTLRQAGYATDGLVARSLSVDDLAWAELIVTVGGDGAGWDRMLPRTTAREHIAFDEPSARASDLDELESYRRQLRHIERALAPLRGSRGTRSPSRRPPPPVASTPGPIRRASSMTMKAVIAPRDARDAREGGEARDSSKATQDGGSERNRAR